MPTDEYGNYTDENGTQGPAPPPQNLDDLLPQMVAQDGGHAYTPESGGMPTADPYAGTDPMQGQLSTPAATPATNPAPATTPAPAAATNSPPSATPAPYSGYVNPFNDAIHGQILSALNQYNTPVSLTDPNLAPQASAYQGARERARRQQQEGNAERAYATGSTTGGLDSATNAGYESAGRDIGAYNANLVGAESEKRRQALLQSLGIGSAVSAAGGSNQLGQDTLGFNVGSEEAALNEALVRALMGGAA